MLEQVPDITQQIFSLIRKAHQAVPSKADIYLVLNALERQLTDPEEKAPFLSLP